MLPNGYEPVLTIYKDEDTGTNFYFDTGIVPTQDTDVNLLFGVTKSPSGDENTYNFGARNSNSVDSAGQLNLRLGRTSYFGYGSGRSSFAHTDFDSLVFYFSNKKNVMTFNAENSELVEVERGATTFTGTRTMYVMAMNNAGNPAYGTTPTMKMYYMSITKGGLLVSELYPAKRTSDGTVGLYDTVRNTFITPSGTTSVTGYTDFIDPRTDGNGTAFVHTPHGDYKMMYILDNGSGSTINDFNYTDVSIEAEPNDGYVFSHWTNKNGAIISYDRVLKSLPQTIKPYGVSGSLPVTAHFKKIGTEKQKNSFMCLGIQYGEGMPSGAIQANEFDLYSMIRSFSIKEDGLTKTNSTIELESMPSAYQVNMPVAIYTNKGKFIWAGVVESIEGNTLKCREGLSILDEDFVFVPNTSWGGLNLTKYTLMGALNKYTEKFFTLHTSSPVAFTDTNDASIRKGETFLTYGESPIRFDNSLSYDNKQNVQLAMPLIEEAEVRNLEDYLLEMFNSTGYGVLAKIHKEPHLNSANKLSYKSYLELEYYYPNRDTILSISDNYENITDVKVSVESQQPTVLEIYNSTGTTCRGVYGMQTDGTISDMVITEDKPLSSFVGYSDCKTVVVLSDDNLNTILVQNLTNAMFNHNITFDLDLTHGMYTLDDFPIGRRVRFYNGNKMYESVVTGKEYALEENGEGIGFIKITLGKVRNSLTAKIKLTEIKKKK